MLESINISFCFTRSSKRIVEATEEDVAEYECIGQSDNSLFGLSVSSDELSRVETAAR